MVDFVLVGALLMVIFLAIIQLALVLHVRNTVVDAASSGAWYGSLADRGPEDARAQDTTADRGFPQPGLCPGRCRERRGLPRGEDLKVTVHTPFPVIGLIGPDTTMEISGHAALQR